MPSPIEIETNHGNKMHFPSVAVLKKWIDQERQHWQWIRDNNKSPISRLHNALNYLDRVRNEAQSLPEDLAEWGDSHREKITRAFRNAYAGSRPHMISSESPEAGLVEALTDEYGEDVGLGALLWFMGEPCLPDNHDSMILQGMVHAAMHETGYALPNISLLKTLKNKLDVLSASLASNQQVLLSLNEATTAQSEAFDTQLSELTEKHEEAFNGLMLESQKSLNAIEETYDQKLALQSSVTYWREKGERHKTRATFWGRVSVGISVAVLFALVVSLQYLFGDSTPAELKAWQLTSFAIALTFGGWLVRTFVKLFISHTHSEQDSLERVTMIQTYLALLRDDQAISSDDKKVILDSLFRPGHFGLIKEDGPGVFDWLNRDR